MNIKKIREALERIANDLSPNSLPIDASMEGFNGIAVRAIADRCFDDAREALAELAKAAKALTDEEIGRISMNICARYCGDGGATWEPDEVSRCMTAIRYVRDNGYLAPSAGLTVEETEQIMETFATWQEDMIRRKDLEKEERIATLRARLNEKLNTKNQ